MVDVSNGGSAHLVNIDSKATSLHIHQHAPDLYTSHEPFLPLSLSSKDQFSYAAVAQFKSRVRRRLRLPSTSPSIMRTLVGALGMVSLCLFYLTHNSNLPQVPTRRISSLTVELVKNHEPMLSGPMDNTTTKYFRK